MNRRSALVAIATGALAGCLSDGSDDGSVDTSETMDSLEGELPPDRVHEFNDTVEYDVVLIQATRLEKTSSVEYRDPEEADIKTWDPGDMQIVVGGFYAQNLSDTTIDYPNWNEFELVTPDGHIEPIIEMPNGISIDEIQEQGMSFPEITELSGDYSRGWSSVYIAPDYESENYALKWGRPDDPIYWR